MRRKLIAGNWKMNKDLQESEKLVSEIIAGLKKIEYDKSDVLICPSFVSLSDTYKQISGTPLNLGAQNMYFENEGAFTGEISANMIKSAGCKYVILGHSERRNIFHESDELINKKVIKAIDSKLTAILCVGEILEERESGKQNEVVKSQIEKGLAGVSSDKLINLVIAYEPVWAIGTGKNATPEEANEMHKFIREIISDLYNKNASDEMRILYGGSLNDKNCEELLSQSDIDGGLIGGASLKSESFLKIIETSNNI
ncbi:MAG TPA: triose-phosphate isomerase [Ignavibacteria bacterium]|nr:triose-phosphate isomerase [Ignavibacteria bacterium]